MKYKGLIISLVVVVGIFLTGLGLGIASYMKYNNMGARHEASLKSAHNASEVVLASMGNKIAEVAQVPGMMKDDLLETTRAAVQGRYGADGSKAVFQAIREVNPSVDPGLYQKIQQVIDSGRNEFVVSQKVVLDRKASYEVVLNSSWSGLWLGFAGYPKMDLDAIKYVSSDRASGAFQSGKEEAIKLR